MLDGNPTSVEMCRIRPVGILPAGATAQILVHDDPYSDRLRCDHPETDDGKALGQALINTAAKCERGRVVVLADAEIAPGLVDAGFEHEGSMPGFYAGKQDCAVMGFYPDDHRGRLANPREDRRVQELVEAKGERRVAPETMTRRALVTDAPEVAHLLDETFDQYPTPSGDPAYIAGAIAGGTPFRVVEQDGDIVACASADLVREARTAELTDCATRPSHRGQGLMQAILADLMDDLRELNYPTAFTLARARIPGVNLAFSRLGFRFRGCMPRSCRIGGGLEDMNIWSRALAPQRAFWRQQSVGEGPSEAPTAIG